MKFVSLSVEETKDLGKRLGRFLDKGDVVLLEGGMASGKTHFVKGIAEALGGSESVTSPTFTILNVYPMEGYNLNHFDVYRVSDEEELLNIGFEEAVFSDDISVIEWADLISGLIPDEYIRIVFSTTDDNTRTLDFDFSKSSHSEEEMK